MNHSQWISRTNEIYQVQFEPNGGDLGRAAVSYIQPIELQIVLPHVAFMLEGLWRLNNSRLPYVYAFEYSGNVKDAIKLVMDTTKLPEHVQWYETDGKTMFEMRGPSGGVVTNYISYLVTKS